MEKIAPGFAATSLRASVVLPVPEGALRMSSSGLLFEVLALLFDILDLLPHALELGLEIHHHRRDAGVLRLGSDGVDLPVHLLHQELQLAAGRRIGADQPAQLLEM